MAPRSWSTAASSIALPVETNRSRRKGANFAEVIGPISSRLALRQNGSFLSLKIRSRTWRLLPRYVPDLGLRLEHGAHRVRELPVERHDLLELVQHEDDATLPFRRELGRQLEQPLDRLVDVLLCDAPPRSSPEQPVGRVDLHRRDDPQAAEEARGLLERLVDGRCDVGAMVFASAAAKRSFVGVRMRSQ